MNARKPMSGIDALAQRISALEAAVRDLSRPKATTIPLVDEDLPETDPGNIWMFADGRLRGRHLDPSGSGAYVYREWQNTSPGTSTSADAAAPPSAAAQTYTSTFGAVWSQSYRQSGAARTDHGTKYLYYGYADGFNGRNKSLVGFDYTAIAAALAGSTVREVKLRLKMLHTYNNSGADVHFGIHNFTSEPASWTSGIPASMITKVHFGKVQQLDVVLPIRFATDIRDGSGKGIALESPSNSHEYYGYAAGVASGYQEPVLIVTYDK